MSGNLDSSQGARKYIDNGNPYISVNSAIMNALNAPKDVQSLDLTGLAKLNAKIMKTNEFSTTRNQRPYSDCAMDGFICRVLSCHPTGKGADDRQGDHGLFRVRHGHHA